MQENKLSLKKHLIKIFLLLLCSTAHAEDQFGYITYSVMNVGDYIQSIAAKRFLPPDSIGIDREFIGVFDHPEQVKTIVNGWFMHAKDLHWYREDVEGPERSWPPSPSIKPLLISLHFWEGFLPYLLTDESIAYLKEHEPIGARDYATMEFLKSNGIESYYSGCLTLTLENPYQELDREEIIYAVDIDQECVDYIKENANCHVVVLSHICRFLPLMNESQKLLYAEQILEKYRKAKCVITQRFHAAMPCLALETPVLYIGAKGPRFGGNAQLLHTCSRKDFINGSSGFDFNNPPKNKPNYLPIREKLIKIVTEWVANDPAGS